MAISDSSAKRRRAEEVADRMHSAAIHLLRRVRRHDEESGITAPHLSALSVLVFGGARTLGELAAAEQVTPPSMTRIVRNLEADGLVEREPDPADGRIVRVRATEAGRRLLTEARTRRIAELADRLGWLSDDEMALLERAAAILEAALV